MPVPEVTLNVDDNELVPYTKPLVVIDAPPSEVIVPPVVAVEDEMDVADAVPDMIGVFNVVNVISGP